MELLFMRSPRLAVLIAALIGSTGHTAAGAEPSVPEFLPSYYAEAIAAGGQDMRFASEGENGGVRWATYNRADDKVSISINWLACARTQCDGLFERNLRQFDIELTTNGGRFLAATQVDFAAELISPSSRQVVILAKLPEGIVSWTQASASGLGESGGRDAAFLEKVEAVSNRHRFEQARRLGNVEVGSWAPTLHRHAQRLLALGRTAEALDVLQQVIAWSPYNFEAQIEFAEHTRDAAAARASAQAVWANAESPALIKRAADLLGEIEPTQASVPLLDGAYSGLRVVLTPLQPCDIRLVTQTARLFEASFDIPVTIARLPEDWRWGRPERVHRQVDMERMIQQATPAVVDFSGWTQRRFAEELRAVARQGTAFGRFQIDRFLEEASDAPGQHDVDAHVRRFIDAVRPYRGEDRRTMFVGVTETDIYIGTANYVFSSGGLVDGYAASILSYHTMTAATLGEAYESRKRLAERLTKELVPASLKQLDIPRPSDPTDPYSYSDGVGRLSEKTLTLSEPTRAALDSFRDR